MVVAIALQSYRPNITPVLRQCYAWIMFRYGYKYLVMN